MRVTPGYNRPVTITCRVCGETKPATSFRRDTSRAIGYRVQCKACYAADMKQRRHAGSGGVDAQRAWMLKHRFDLTVEQYDAMLEKQGGVCGMCGQTCSSGRRLAVDHDHQTGRVRGLLCVRCNRGLGAYELHRENAERYLQKTE